MTVNSICATTLRVATAADAQALTAIAHASKRHWGYPEAYIVLWRDALTISAAYLASHRVVIAEQNDCALGFYALDGRLPRQELDALFVLPAAMGRGIGKQLFRRACQDARAVGANTLTIAADPNAERFYTKQGARRVGWVDSQPTGRRLPLLNLSLV